MTRIKGLEVISYNSFCQNLKRAFTCKRQALLKFFIRNSQYTGRKSLSTKAQSNQTTEGEGIVNRSPDREKKIQREQTCPNTTLVMWVISKGADAKSAWKARRPHADFHKCQTTRHHWFRHTILATIIQLRLWAAVGQPLLQAGVAHIKFRLYFLSVMYHTSNTCKIWPAEFAQNLCLWLK